jgi:hypothetical protein
MHAPVFNLLRPYVICAAGRTRTRTRCRCRRSRRGAGGGGGGAVPGGGGAVRRGDAGAGRVAVLHAQAHALRPVHVPAVPLVAPPRGGALRVRGAVRPPRGRRAHGDAVGRRGLPGLRHVPARRRGLLRLRHRQGRRRPLRRRRAVEPVPRRVPQQHRLPRRAPPARRRPPQLLPALLRGLGPPARHARAVRAQTEGRRRSRGQGLQGASDAIVSCFRLASHYVSLVHRLALACTRNVCSVTDDHHIVSCVITLCILLGT